MIKAIIIEDEKPAQDLLLDALSLSGFDIEVLAVIQTVQEGIDYFRLSRQQVDIIFSDVQLGDGLSFDIFRNTGIRVPVIFITGYDKFMLYAFESNGIDYLLKPLDRDELNKSIHKYRMLENHFSHKQSLENLLNFTGPRKKTRLVVKKGIESISMKLDDVVMFYTENKMVYLIDKNEKKFIVDRTLNELEQELDDSVFFRANRQYIINLNYVKCYRPYEKVKLQVDLNIADNGHFIIISQITAPYFRKWISEA